MLRFDHCVCGTTTTGTGTLTLAATPVPPGGVDFDVWARAMGFGNSAALLVSYEIIEFADSAFTKAHQAEKGIGTLTLGTSSGIANCTLARTTIQRTVTSMDSPPASVSIAPATGVSIGTAANTLVLVAPSAEEIVTREPYFETAATGLWSNFGLAPKGLIGLATNVYTNPFETTTNDDFYVPFDWDVPMLVKRVSFLIGDYASITGSPAMYVRLYAVGTDGRPGKLLYDFTGATGVSITATGAYSALSSGSGYLLTPGSYFMDFTMGGLTGGALKMTSTLIYNANPGAARLGVVSSGVAYAYARANGGTAGAGPDPANTTNYVVIATSLGGNGTNSPIFGLSPS